MHCHSFKSDVMDGVGVDVLILRVDHIVYQNQIKAYHKYIAELNLGYFEQWP